MQRKLADNSCVAAFERGRVVQEPGLRVINHKLSPSLLCVPRTFLKLLKISNKNKSELKYYIALNVDVFSSDVLLTNVLIILAVAQTK